MNDSKKDKGLTDTDLGEALGLFIISLTRGYSLTEGTVTSVDLEAFTADVKTGDATYHAVPLRVLTGAQASYVEIPKADTIVLLMFRYGNIGQPQIVMVQEVEKILITSPLVVFNGGELGGMVKAKELKEQSDKDKAVLTGLLGVINGPPINEPGNGAPSAFQAALKLALAGKQPGSWDNLENPKITQ